ncbi:YigZ family protein [Rummeliibacillus suwonensis]|uniref:YigZ family protein n=1 Tax=Rummeliibacillus suwonensis TaxID=1306154 RepID=UPI001AAFA999|nr:YigZ family protein [Rummeliibacillus suwonensis]MBO2534248.1 YigZ family protein [Rummeliibacillus suwonensis]
MRKNYLTLKKDGNSEIVISKSRFIANCKRVETEQEAIDFIQSIKKAHRSATHNCSAYLIGEQDQIQKASDDGEPSGTAGVPILEVLKKQHLKDTVVVITRYFGGIKLGAGGLVRAYGKATTAGIDASGIVERRLHHLMKIVVDYVWLGKLENEIRNSPYSIKNINYADRVEFFVFVPKEEESSFTEWLVEMTNGQATITRDDILFLEFEKSN